METIISFFIIAGCIAFAAIVGWNFADDFTNLKLNRRRKKRILILERRAQANEQLNRDRRAAIQAKHEHHVLEQKNWHNEFKALLSATQPKAIESTFHQLFALQPDRYKGKLVCSPCFVQLTERPYFQHSNEHCLGVVMKPHANAPDTQHPCKCPGCFAIEEEV